MCLPVEIPPHCSPLADMYSLHDYGNMIGDRGRTDAYAKAIANSVRPGDAVVDIGCGSGMFALLACRAGARRVYAIEADGIIQVARWLAADNGLADRIEFIQNDSRRVELSERVNVIVSDVRGALPFLGPAIPSIEDARQRFLAPGGILIPERDVLRAAVVDVKEFYERLTSPWQKAAEGLDLSSSRSLILNASYGISCTPEQLLTEPQTWLVLDYAVGTAAHATATLRFRIARSGTSHGLCLWFETQLFGDIGFSSGPAGSSTVYGQIFLPWLEPATITEGQEIHIDLRADLVGQDYVWSWNTDILASDGAPPKHFQQSTFHGANFSPRLLRCHATDFVPELSDEGQADRWLLQAMDGSTSLQQIAQSAAQRFPGIFPSTVDALRRATELAEKLSR
jgi:type I protein arginine methyltransferase